ncbi:hypothetical protein MiTs_01161 [Microcystis aeruginosa NIES-2521]|uniref:PEP-CTERM protein-sorting domain-containing protein n=2 Tax=Microcystis aeruginosa TaxID=1126 RepID=A0A5A5RRI6_MICAE|nr:hypothetical protein MiTs_01161 [Microcystis aeruginosa NIES-2521]
MYTMKLKAIGYTFLASVVSIFSANGLGSKVLASTTYNVSLDINKYGYLNQNHVPGIGIVACVPVATVNSFIFLQNMYPGIYGNKLTGNTYESWKQTALDLAGYNYMRTNLANGGTSAHDFVWGKINYFNDKAPGTTSIHGQVIGASWTPERPKPSFIESVFPTWNFLFNELSRGQDIEIGFQYDSGSGHALTLSSFNWIDANMDGVIQQGENATIDFIDPLDPGTGPAQRTFGQIFNDPIDNRLRFTYDQIGAGNVSGWINMAVAESPIPEPSTILGLLVIGGLGLGSGLKGKKN